MILKEARPIGVIAVLALFHLTPTWSQETPREWVDEATGHRVVRLSELPGSLSFYFHQNAYTPEGDKLLISTPRGLETVDLKTRELTLVVPDRAYSIGGSSGIEMGRKTRHVYYSARSENGMVVRATHVDTGATRDMAELPRGASFNSVNADETFLFGAMREGGFRQGGERAMRLFVVDTETGGLTTFHPSTDWLNHLQCSPTDPGFGLFCHEGSWHELDRVWTIRFGEDEARLMHRREMDYEIAGHEFFGPDGKWVWYDLQTPRSEQFWLAGVQVDTGERVRYRVNRDEWSVHYNVSRDGKLFAGDGGGPGSVANHTGLPEKRRFDPPRNGQWIYLFRPGAEFEPATVGGEPARSGRLIAERLVDLSAHDYDLEPNVTFTPDGKWIVFRSNMHGESHVYAVAVEPEKGRARAETSEAVRVDQSQWSFDFGGRAPGLNPIGASDFYSDLGWGLEPGAKVVSKAQAFARSELAAATYLEGSGPFSFSVGVPEGNYRVRVVWRGDLHTVKAEVRRLMVENANPDSGEVFEMEFLVNVRRPLLLGGGEVRLKEREKTTEKRNWDDKLTLEFNGESPRICSVDIESALDAPTVYLLGDSTVADQAIAPAASWGQMLPRFFNSQIAIASHAESGESIRSSLSARRVDKVFSLVRPGDFVMFQFGHNDMKDPEPDALDRYRENLMELVRATRDLGGTPILVTSMERKIAEGEETLGDYPETVRRIGREMNVATIDLNTMSKQLYAALGADLEKIFVDGTHHNNQGAYLLAQCVAEGVRQETLGLARYLVDDFRGFDPSAPSELLSMRRLESPVPTR